MADKKHLPLWQRRAGAQVVKDLPNILGGAVVGLVIGGLSAALTDLWPGQPAFVVCLVASVLGLAVGVVAASIRAPYVQRNAARAAHDDVAARLSAVTNEDFEIARKVSVSSRVILRRKAEPRSRPLTAPVEAASRVQVSFHNGSEFALLGVRLCMDPRPHAEPQHHDLRSEAGPGRKDDTTFNVAAYLPEGFTPRTWAEFDPGSGRRWKRIENQKPELLTTQAT